MSIATEIEKEIRHLLDSRYRQIDIADKMNIKQSQLSVLLNGGRSWGGLRLDTVDRMFPDATIHLYGDGRAAAAPAPVFDRSRLISAVLALDIDDSAKIKVLKMLEGF